MKKMLFAAAAMIAAMTANAVGFDYTTASTYEAAASTWILNLNNAAIVAGDPEPISSSDPSQGNYPAGKNTINAVEKADASFTVGGITFFIPEAKASAGSAIAKTYSHYIQPNGGNRTVKVPTTAGQQVTVVVDAAVTGLTITGVSESTVTEFAAGSNVFTATGSEVTFTNGDAKPKYKAITVGTASAANDAEADAEFAYSVKINGQKVNAKVYNEPVIEVSSNGSAKVVINKK